VRWIHMSAPPHRDRLLQAWAGSHSCGFRMGCRSVSCRSEYGNLAFGDVCEFDSHPPHWDDEFGPPSWCARVDASVHIMDAFVNPGWPGRWLCSPGGCFERG